MLLSKLCSLRTKEIPSDAKMKSHQLMLRAGYMKQVANGIYTLTALGQRTCLNIENIITLGINLFDILVMINSFLFKFLFLFI